MYEITNILEKIVTDRVDSILPTLDGVCACDQCRADIICLCLNGLQPCYVVHRIGEILGMAEFETTQKKTEIMTTILRSARQVAENPHQDTDKETSPAGGS
jgi:competence protein ComFB